MDFNNVDSTRKCNFEGRKESRAMYHFSKKFVISFILAVLLLIPYTACTTVSSTTEQGHLETTTEDQIQGPVSTRSEQIAFVSDRDGNLEIYVMNSDGSMQTRLTTHEADDEWPSMSPDGKQIVFISNRDEPNRFSCMLTRDCNSEVYIINTDGTGLTRLTDSPNAEMFPMWSPDGTHIAFERNNDIYKMNLDGSNQINLTNDDMPNLYPIWMPDGQHIVILSARDGSLQFYTMNADGSDLQMMDSGLPPSTFPKKIYIVLGKNGQFYIRLDDLLYHSMEDSGSALGEFPMWSPDGTKIAFHSDRDGNLEIYVINADGSGFTRLTNNEAEDNYPTWSPDGEEIVFHSDRDGNNEIYVINADGTNLGNLTNNPANDTTPSWTP